MAAWVGGSVQSEGILTSGSKQIFYMLQALGWSWEKNIKKQKCDVGQREICPWG